MANTFCPVCVLGGRGDHARETPCQAQLSSGPELHAMVLHRVLGTMRCGRARCRLCSLRRRRCWGDAVVVSGSSVLHRAVGVCVL